MSRALAIIAAAALFAALLTAWRLLYRGADTAQAGLAALALLGAISLLGGYKTALAGRRAMLDAALERGTRLRGLMTGRAGAALSALLATGAALPPAAYFALGCSLREFRLVLALGAGLALLVLLFDALARGRIRVPLRLAVLGPQVVILAGLSFGAVHMALAYLVLPLPAYLLQPTLASALQSAVAGLPAHHDWIYAPLAAMRMIEALGYWLVTQDWALQGPAVVLFLLQGAAVYLSLAKLALDALALLLPGREAGR